MQFRVQLGGVREATDSRWAEGDKSELRRALYGQRSERKERLLDQLELALDEITASATEDDLAAEKAAAGTTEVKGFVRRKPFPEHLPRERVVVPGPTACACCGSERLSKIGDDVTETPEVIPRQCKVIQTVREKFACRDCDNIPLRLPVRVCGARGRRRDT